MRETTHRAQYLKKKVQRREWLWAYVILSSIVSAFLFGLLESSTGKFFQDLSVVFFFVFLASLVLMFFPVFGGERYGRWKERKVRNLEYLRKARKEAYTERFVLQAVNDSNSPLKVDGILHKVKRCAYKNEIDPSREGICIAIDRLLNAEKLQPGERKGTYELGDGFVPLVK